MSDCPIQLYTLCRELNNRRLNEQELGDIIGNTVTASLLEFRTISSSDEEIRFQEVKIVYAGLQSAITIIDNEGWFRAFCSSKSKVEAALSTRVEETYQSQLLNELLPALRERPKQQQDILRRRGIALYREIIYGEEREYTRTYDALTNNYKILMNVLRG